MIRSLYNKTEILIDFDEVWYTVADSDVKKKDVIKI